MRTNTVVGRPGTNRPAVPRPTAPQPTAVSARLNDARAIDVSVMTASATLLAWRAASVPMGRGRHAGTSMGTCTR